MMPSLDYFVSLRLSDYDLRDALLVARGAKPASLLAGSSKPHFEYVAERLDAAGVSVGFLLDELVVGAGARERDAVITSASRYELGIALGFPRTAAEAFENGTVLRPEDENYLLFHPDYARSARFASFRRSRDYWAAELNTGKQWGDVIAAHHPDLYTRILHSVPFKLLT